MCLDVTAICTAGLHLYFQHPKTLSHGFLVFRLNFKCLNILEL